MASPAAQNRNPESAGSGVRTVEIAAEDDGIRLDRWFRRHVPDLPHGRLEKLLRTGQVRLDGKRAKANARLAAGSKLRLPPMPGGAGTANVKPQAKPPGAKEAAALRALVLHKDAEVLALNKPAGLAVQGGSGTGKHLDAMLDALQFEAHERPRLVHRLDKDTSGVLLLGRTRQAAAKLAASFRGRDARKVYWALTAGVPRPKKGRIDLPLAKIPGKRGERVEPDESGKRAVTYYAVVEALADKAAWVALMPQTGRTHQLRAHMAALGTPILGDGKYGGPAAFVPGLPKKLHLHARDVEIPHPKGGRLKVTAPLQGAMLESFRLFGFDPESEEDYFAGAPV